MKSYKWWPGELAVYCDMCILYAKTIINGKKVGVFPFILELRDRETRKIYDGIELGDIGPKIGYQSKDNGYLKFNHFKIPEENLLSKFFKIKKNTIKVQGNPKIIYAGMMKVRINLLGYSAH